MQIAERPHCQHLKAREGQRQEVEARQFASDTFHILEVTAI